MESPKYEKIYYFFDSSYKKQNIYGILNLSGITGALDRR